MTARQAYLVETVQLYIRCRARWPDLWTVQAEQMLAGLLRELGE